MPIYDIQTPDGKIISIEGDREPTIEDMERAYNEYLGNTKENKVLPKIVGGLGKLDQGLSFGLGKKLGGHLNALGSYPVDRLASFAGVENTPTYSDRYNEIVGETNKESDNFERNYPKTAFTLELAGSLANPLNIKGAKYVNSLPRWEKVATAGGLGGLTSTLDTLGRSNNVGEFNDDILKNASLGAGINTVFPLAGLSYKGLGKAGRKLLGLTTGTGDAVDVAYNAGLRGSKIFEDNIKGNTSMTEVVEDAKDLLSKIKETRNKQYEQSMLKLGENEQKLNFAPIRKELNDIIKSYDYKGYNSAKGSTAKALDRINKAFNEFEKTPDAHTAIGFDKLKQAVQDITFPLEERNANRIVSKVSNTIKNEINKQNPNYKQIMQDYSSASDEIEELGKSLLGGRKPNPSQSLGKLQRAFRNNALSGYGNNSNLLQKLQGDEDIITDALAGQALNSWLPRGLVGGIGSLGALASAIPNTPISLTMLPTFSPRLMGGLAFNQGKIDKTVSPLLKGLNPSALYNVIEKN